MFDFGIISAFKLSLLGPLGALLIVTFFGFLFGLLDIFKYLVRHWLAVLFVLFNAVLNVLYRRFGLRNRLAEDCQLLNKISSNKKAIIIPGTWSHIGYDWNRWKAYCDNLTSQGYEIYGLRWDSSNSELGRRRTAIWLDEWITCHCVGASHCILIGHSYGAQVAALCSKNCTVTSVLAIAAPFVHLEPLQKEEIASNALAFFTRSLVVVLIVLVFGWLSFGILVSEILALLAFAFYVIYVFIRLVNHIRDALPFKRVSGFPTAVKFVCIQVVADPIVNQLVDSTKSEYVTPGFSKPFLDQMSLKAPGLKIWYYPFLIFCLGFFFAINLMNIDQRFLNLPGTEKTIYFNDLIIGTALFFSFSAFIYIVSSVFNIWCSVRRYLFEFLAIASWRAFALDNRRFVVFLLSGFTGFERTIFSIRITNTIDELPVVFVKLARVGLWKTHSAVIEDESIARDALSMIY